MAIRKALTPPVGRTSGGTLHIRLRGLGVWLLKPKKPASEGIWDYLEGKASLEMSHACPCESLQEEPLVHNPPQDPLEGQEQMEKWVDAVKFQKRDQKGWQNAVVVK